MKFPVLNVAENGGSPIVTVEAQDDGGVRRYRADFTRRLPSWDLNARNKMFFNECGRLVNRGYEARIPDSIFDQMRTRAYGVIAERFHRQQQASEPR